MTLYRHYVTDEKDKITWGGAHTRSTQGHAPTHETRKHAKKHGTQPHDKYMKVHEMRDDMMRWVSPVTYVCTDLCCVFRCFATAERGRMDVDVDVE